MAGESDKVVRHGESEPQLTIRIKPTTLTTSSHRKVDGMFHAWHFPGGGLTVSQLRCMLTNTSHVHYPFSTCTCYEVSIIVSRI
jgi:hypothetical protein